MNFKSLFPLLFSFAYFRIRGMKVGEEEEERGHTQMLETGREVIGKGIYRPALSLPTFTSAKRFALKMILFKGKHANMFFRIMLIIFFAEKASKAESAFSFCCGET